MQYFDNKVVEGSHSLAVSFMRTSQNFVWLDPDCFHVIYLLAESKGWQCTTYNDVCKDKRKVGHVECLWEAPNSGKLEWRWLPAGSQLHQVTYLHPPSQWASLHLILLTLAAAIFLHLHFPILSVASAEEKLVSEKRRAQKLCSALSNQRMLKGGREKKGQILLLPGSDIATEGWVAGSSFVLRGVDITAGRSVQCFKPSLAAAITNLPGVLVEY